MQTTTYICGHRNPDTDAIVSAMALASPRSGSGIKICPLPELFYADADLRLPGME